MKFQFLFLLILCLLFPIKTKAKSPQFNSVCKSFLTGEIDAFKTLDALNLNIDYYSLGVNNTVKIYCS